MLAQRCLFVWPPHQWGTHRLNVSLFAQENSLWKRWAIWVEKGHQAGGENRQNKPTLFGGNKQRWWEDWSHLAVPRVLHRLLRAPLPASWTESGEKSTGVARGCLDGMRVRRKREPSHQLFWQPRNPSAETRPSLKCELYCVSKAGCSKKWLGGRWFILG